MNISHIVILLSLFVLPACSFGGLGEPSKPLHFYTIGPVTNEPRSESRPDQSVTHENGIHLSVDEFQASGIYQEQTILWRDGQHLQRFQFNRWANPPAQMIQDTVVELLRRESGEHISWVSDASEGDFSSPFAIQGKLKHIYLSRDNENWTLTLHVDLKLIKQDPEQTVSPTSLSPQNLLGRWSISAKGSTTAPSGEPETPSAMNKLIQSLNRDLSTSGGQIANQVLDRIQDHNSTGNQENNSSK